MSAERGKSEPAVAVCTEARSGSSDNLDLIQQIIKEFNKVAALGISDSRLYKMSGNSVSVPVIKAIGERIRDIIFDEG